MDLTAGLMCEQGIASIHQRQVEHGVCFDKRRAHWYIYSLNERLLKLYLKVKPYLSYTTESPNGYKSTLPFTKKGDYTKVTSAWFNDNVSDVSGEFCKVIFDDPDQLLTKREKLGKQLIKLGWKPKSKTPTGVPVLVKGGIPCPNLSKFGEVGQSLSQYYILMHRRNQIIGFLKYVYCDTNGIYRIKAHANTIGTPTFRYTHKNVANIPSGGATFGKEMRSLFTVPKGYKAIGTDASGLELRMLAHYMNSPEYTDVVLNGDIHTHNQEIAGVASRGIAKGMIYCLLYGGGNAKLGETCGATGSQKAKANYGQQIRNNLMTGLPHLKKLTEQVQKKSQSGVLTAIDGRRLIMRKDPKTGDVMTHKALNMLFQSAGSICVKYGTVLLNEWIKELELDATIVIHYHDEVFIECKEEHVELVERLCHHWMTASGIVLGTNIRLDSDVKVGRTWYDVH